jgi:hypothetical protein
MDKRPAWKKSSLDEKKQKSAENHKIFGTLAPPGRFELPTFRLGVELIAYNLPPHKFN